MNDFFETIGQFANQWAGTALSNLFLIFFGILLCILVIAAIWDKRRYFSWNIQYGTSITAPVTIVLVISAVVYVGMLAPQVMIGDEVTHYYMMETQSEDLSSPNFIAKIPTGWGDEEVRHYPHSFLWHYLAALVSRVSNGSFFAVQLFHSLFLAQLLWVAYLLAASRGGVKDRSALLYLMLIGSMPMVLIFSVAFYQDVPMAAQILTAFYLLRRERWLLASLFICFALGIKVTAILFFPAFFMCLIFWTLKRKGLTKTVFIVLFSLFLVCGFTWGFGKVIHKYSGIKFYPVQEAEKIYDKITVYLPNGNSPQDQNNPENRKTPQEQHHTSVPSEQMARIIANHPGDLRIPTNYFVYGGILIYLTLAGAVLSLFLGQFKNYPQKDFQKDSSFWLWSSGVSYIVMVAFLLKTSPDARFFLPGVVFCLLPLAERMVRLPWPRLLVMVFTALALMQAGYSLAKTYNLRNVRPELEEAINFLQGHTPLPHRIFMYPEGNYRLFPAPHEWYLRYHLRDFWRTENTKRIKMLNERAIGVIVIKKYLISTVDEEITNLGVYPVDFVNDIESDARFKKIFENNAVMMYQVP